VAGVGVTFWEKGVLAVAKEVRVSFFPGVSSLTRPVFSDSLSAILQPLEKQTNEPAGLIAMRRLSWVPIDSAELIELCCGKDVLACRVEF
jgi:hypothetical protein